MVNIFNRLLIIAEDDNWISDVDIKQSTPEGLFTKSTATIVEGLLKQTKNNIGKAIQKITFYINRAGSNLTNKVQVMKAKKMLQVKK